VFFRLEIGVKYCFLIVAYGFLDYNSWKHSRKEYFRRFSAVFYHRNEKFDPSSVSNQKCTGVFKISWMNPC